MANTISPADAFNAEILRQMREQVAQSGHGGVTAPPPQLQKAVVQKKDLALPGQDYTIHLSKVENGYIVSVVRTNVGPGQTLRYVATEVKEIVELAVAAIVSNRLDAVS